MDANLVAGQHCRRVRALGWLALAAAITCAAALAAEPCIKRICLGQTTCVEFSPTLEESLHAPFEIGISRTSLSSDFLAGCSQIAGPLSLSDRIAQESFTPSKSNGSRFGIPLVGR